MENHAAEATAPPSDSPQFQHYQILSRLGQGGYGEVFEAWDSKLRRKVAIKRHKTIDPLRDAASLVNEARMTASLQHPAFAQIYAIEEDQHGQAIVMELIEGQTWRALAAAGPLGLATVLGWMKQLAEAMQAAHDAGVSHGDLKPSNLMLDPSGKVRILDLGLAFHDDPQATTSVIQLEQQGTIAYMAPEVLLGAAPGRQSDIYAMGVILYELATGARPFAAMHGLALAAALMQSSSADWPYPDSLPLDVADLIRAMTARRPDQRMTTMCSLVSQLARCMDRLEVNECGKQATLKPLGAARWLKQIGRTIPLMNKRALVTGIAALALCAGCWQLVSYLSAERPPLPSFSKANAISNALLSLQQFAQPARLDIAARDFSAILESEPDNAAAVAGMSLVYGFRYSNDQQDETWLMRAAASAQQALKLDSQLALAHSAMAMVLLRKGPLEDGLAESERALALDPGHFFGTLAKGSILTKLRRYNDARTWMEQAIQRDPDQPAFADTLGTILFQQGNYSEAEAVFRRSIELQPDSPLAYTNLNGVLLRLNRSEEGLGVLQRGLQVRPHGGLYAALGNALFVRGDYVGAADAFQRSVSPPVGNPNHYLRWANLGDTLLWIPGRSTQAREAYIKAIALLGPQLARTPRDPALMSRMALFSARTGDKPYARDLLSKAISLAPASPDVQFRAGLAYELLGERDLALTALAQAKQNGYPAAAIESEPDLVALRRDTRYLSTPPHGAKQ